MRLFHFYYIYLLHLILQLTAVTTSTKDSKRKHKRIKIANSLRASGHPKKEKKGPNQPSKLPSKQPSDKPYPDINTPIPWGCSKKEADGNIICDANQTTCSNLNGCRGNLFGYKICSWECRAPTRPPRPTPTPRP